MLDWAASAARTHRVRLIVLRHSTAEWPVPAGCDLVRLDTSLPLVDQLHIQGRAIVATGHPRILCHLLRPDEREALAHGGADPISVVHNARQGWIDGEATCAHGREVIAVSESAADDLKSLGARAHVARHFPRAPHIAPNARSRWRSRWAIPDDAFCIGMIGGVKPQKAYPHALRILAAMRSHCDAYLAILGGPIGRDGQTAWHAVIQQAVRLGVDRFVRLPGFVANAALALPAFDVLLNTSRYEGVSIATLEALAAGLPVVASQVGGQCEVPAPALHLLAPDADTSQWCSTIAAACAMNPPAASPDWLGFPSARLWTLFELDAPKYRGHIALFVTANLNAGGAQRSLVNLAKQLNSQLPLEIAVCGNSSASAFVDQLQHANVAVFRTMSSRDCFDHAEALLRRIGRGDIGQVIFWNIDPKIKLLLAKRLTGSPLRLIDVSPGHYAFEEMDQTRDFQSWIAYRSKDYYESLHRLVLKYDTSAPVSAAITTIPNGVPLADRVKRYGTLPRKVVVSGRIAPTKFLLEIVAALRIVWAAIPDAELHLLGTAEPRHQAYSEQVFAAIGSELNRHVFAHGATFDAPTRVAQYDIALVIGHHQGSPNAVLEAMAAGLAIVANDSGGTKELVSHGRTGLLLSGHDADSIAQALLRLMNDARLAAWLARNGCHRVRQRYSMARMAAAYRHLLT